MSTFLIVVVLLAVAAGVTFLLMKKGKIEDKNGNNIPDKIEPIIESAKEVVSEVKEIVEKVKVSTKPVTKKPAEKKPAAKKPAATKKKSK